MPTHARSPLHPSPIPYAEDALRRRSAGMTGGFGTQP
jgi:hypothetical protein